jgi:hypothetical protein
LVCDDDKQAYTKGEAELPGDFAELTWPKDEPQSQNKLQFWRVIAWLARAIVRQLPGVAGCLFLCVQAPHFEILLVEGRLLEIAFDRPAKTAVSHAHLIVVVYPVHQLFHPSCRD